MVSNSNNINVSLTAAGNSNEILINNDILGNNITITADRFLLDTTITPTKPVINGINSVTIQPFGNTKSILGGGQTFGDDLVSNTFNLSNSELSRITTPNLTIGRASAGGGLTTGSDFYKDTNLTLRNRDFIDIQHNITLPENIIAQTNRANSITLASNNIYIDTTKNITGGIDNGSGVLTNKALLRANLYQATNGIQIDVGGADSGTNSGGLYNLLGITDAELDRFSANVIQVGNDNSGNITITSVINPDSTLIPTANKTLRLNTGGAITDTTGYIEEDNLAIRAVGNVILDNTNNDINNLGGIVRGAGSAFTLVDKDNLTINTADGFTGLSTNNGNITVSTLDGNLVVANTSAANDVSSGTANIILKSETTAGTERNININSNAVVNGGNITLTAEDMLINGNLIATGRAILQNFKPNTQINLGSTTDTNTVVLEISNAELNRVAANIIQVGNTTNTGAVAVTDNMTVSGAGTLSVRSTDNITDTGSGKINKSNLNLELIAKDVKLDNTDNNTGTLAGQSTNGSFVFLDNNNLIVGSVDSSTGANAGITATNNNTGENGNIILKSGIGSNTLTINQKVVASDNITLVSGGTLTLNSLIQVDNDIEAPDTDGIDTLAIRSLNGSITQSGISPIEGGNNNTLIALANNNITLENNNNNFGKVALESANASGTNAITYTDTDSVQIASGTAVDNTVITPFSVTGIKITGANAKTGIEINGAGDLTQSEKINSNNFAGLTNDGNIILNNPNNQVSTVALQSKNGEIQFVSSQDLSVGAVNTTNIPDLKGITNSGTDENILVESKAKLTIDKPVSATDSISLISKDDLIINNGGQITIDSDNDNSSVLYLKSTNGSIKQTTASIGLLSDSNDILLGSAKNNINLLSNTNDFSKVAFISESGGNINYIDADGFTISAGISPHTIETISGISTVNGYVGLSSIGVGNINQNQIINAKGLVATTFDGNITLNIPNEVQEVAFNAAGNGDIEFTNKNGFKITSLNSSATGIVNGINAVGNKVKLQVSNNGNITQNQAIQANELSVINRNGNTILNNTNNNINVLAIQADKGNLEFTDLNGFDINTIDNIAGLKVNGNINLITQAGNITQGSDSVNSVIANTLNIITDSGNASLNNTSNNINIFKTSSQTGNINLFDNAGLSVLDSNIGNGNLTIISNAGSLDLLGDLNAKNINLSTINGGNIDLNSNNLTGQNGIYLNSSQNIKAAGRDNYPKLTAPRNYINWSKSRRQTISNWFKLKRFRKWLYY